MRPHKPTRYRRPAAPRRKGIRRRDNYPAMKPGADASLKRIFADIGVPKKKPFRPDSFQVQALACMERADCLVTAPTGSGKTWIAEQVILKARSEGQRAWYASPLKALTNSKYTDFSLLFGADQVGILTGDRKENPDAPIIVGTTEILRNQLYDAMHQGEQLDTDVVILDEAHFLGDEDRGVVWEETMIYLPSRIPLLMLSATIGNADQVATWLSKVRGRPCEVVQETQRPVPLTPLFLHPSGTLLPLVTKGGTKKKAQVHKKIRSYLSVKKPLYLAPPNRLPPFGEILRILAKFRLLPAIFFLKSRVDCDQAVTMCREERKHDPDVDDRRRRRVYDLIADNPHIAHHRQRRYLEHDAVGAHHAGQLPAWKLTLETLMKEGLLDAIFATSTVAAGVNFPARTVVFLNSDRFNGKEFLPLDATEFHQMTGRAGRRGMDRIGFAMALPGKFMDIRHAARLVHAPPSYIYSRIRINFSMVLNLLLSHSPEQIEDLLTRSFAAYLINQKSKKNKGRQSGSGADFLIEDFHRHLEFLQEKAYVTKDGQLTEDGIWASQLRVDQPLLIAEGFRMNAFPGDDPALLASVIAALVGEKETKEDMDLKWLPEHLWEAFSQTQKALRPFQRHMTSRGFETRPMLLKPAVTAFQWASGTPWEKVVALGKIEEGDLVMLMLRTADNLRHIKALGSVFPQAAETAREAMGLLLNPPVSE